MLLTKNDIFADYSYIITGLTITDIMINIHQCAKFM